MGRNWAVCSIDDEVVLDQVGRYESLVPDVTSLCERVGIEFDGWLPTAKSGVAYGSSALPRGAAPPRRPQTIARKCAPEIEAFGYEF